MIKYIINKIKNIFKPERQDPHIVLYEEIKPEHCDGHTRFKKSCPTCQEIIK
tara:strand:+ start:364 stop:519 length:156 start_codon:yes stop_codon:yes gene_type:complete